MSKKIIALISDDFEDLELWYPVHRLREEDGVTAREAAPLGAPDRRCGG